MLATKTIRVLCVDDHEFLTEGLMARMALEADLACVGSLTSAESLVEKAKEVRPDVVLLDIEMPGPDALERLADLKRILPDVAVVILSAHVRDGYIDVALQRGADGYFSKSDAPAKIFEGIRRAAGGRTALGDAVSERMRGAAARGGVGRSRLSELTPREIEVLRLIGKGMSRAQIAQQLCRSLKTVDAHHTSIMRKLDIHDRAELTRYAIGEGLAEA